MQHQRPGRGAAAANAIVVAVPSELKSLVPALQNVVRIVAARVDAAARDGKAMDYAAIEREFAECLGAVERAAHECTLSALATEAKHIEVHGERYHRVAIGTGTYFTMTGPVRARRGLYRKARSRNAKTVDAIALRAGVVGDGWLPHAAQAMAHLHQLGTSREAAQVAHQLGRLPYSRASFERVPHVVAALWQAKRTEIEDRLLEDLEVPESATAISVSLDRTSIPMEEPAARPVGRPRKGAPKRPVTRQFRMAYCATLTMHDDKGQALRTLRYGQMPNLDPQHLCNTLADDALRLRAKQPTLELALLADGAPEMWNLLEANFPAGVFGNVHRTVDLWHLLEKLAPAAKLMHADPDAARATLHRWRTTLRRRTDAAATIRLELERSGLEQSMVDSQRPVHDAITYLRNHVERMNWVFRLLCG